MIKRGIPSTTFHFLSQEIELFYKQKKGSWSASDPESYMAMQAVMCLGYLQDMGYIKITRMRKDLDWHQKRNMRSIVSYRFELDKQLDPIKPQRD